MTDGSQAVVWDATYNPFGEVHSITGSATLNLRFPGQYFLIESGLHYNWHRHYDPTLGRYAQPDRLAEQISFSASSSGATSLSLPRNDAVPLPFQDGPSLYAYARSAPTQNVDPQGSAAAAIAGAAALCARFPVLCAATIKAAADACVATYKSVMGRRVPPGFCSLAHSFPIPGGYMCIYQCEGYQTFISAGNLGCPKFISPVDGKLINDN
jgi:RHS repeat-associated protein